MKTSDVGNSLSESEHSLTIAAGLRGQREECKGYTVYLRLRSPARWAG
jgi:hypothetical protein